MSNDGRKKAITSHCNTEAIAVVLNILFLPQAKDHVWLL
jgi:hypothetical protein